MIPYINLKQGLVGAWCPSLRYTDNKLIDYTQYNNIGTVNNAAWNLYTQYYGLSFDSASSALVNYNNRLRIQASSTLSIAFWVYVGAITDDLNVLTRYDAQASGPTDYFGIAPSGGGTKAIGFIGDATNNVSFDTAALLPTSIWTHVCFVSDMSAASYKIYINGLEVPVTVTTAGTPSTSFATSNVLFRSGVITNASGVNIFSSGTFNDLRAYSRLLTDSEVRLMSSYQGIGLLPLNNYYTTPPLYPLENLDNQAYQNVNGDWVPAEVYARINNSWNKAGVIIKDSGSWVE